MTQLEDTTGKIISASGNVPDVLEGMRKAGWSSGGKGGGVSPHVK